MLRALHTPGHAPDHFCFLDEATRDVYCGDLARRGGTIVIPASAGGNLVQYLASLRRIRALQPRRLLPGHGPVVEDPVSLIDGYLDHRVERESQVLGALRSGATSVDALVQRIYTNLHPTVVRAAADSVLAHLIKLRDEGRVVEQDGEWRPM
jgi:glyoxylase-like metal-dependent hydrolase (beta-lactamase superfamily II)